MATTPSPREFQRCFDHRMAATVYDEGERTVRPPAASNCGLSPTRPTRVDFDLGRPAQSALIASEA